MSKRSIFRFVQLLFCWVFALSLLVGCGSYEIVSSHPYFPSSAQVRRDGVLYAIPRDLRAELNDAVAQWQARAQNGGGDRRYVAQMPNPISTMQQQLLKTVLDWATGKSPDQRLETLEERRKAIDEALPLPHLEDPWVQFSGGVLAGAAEGGVPLGPVIAEVGIELKVLPKGTYWARVGKACGEFVVGVGQIIVGCEGVAGGGVLSSTGGGAVVGVPLIAASYGIAVNGGATAGAALGHAAELWDEGPPSEPAPEPEVKLLQPRPKPAPQEPVAAAPPPAAKPAQQAPPVTKPQQAAPPAAPARTRTTTRNKSTGVTTTTTEGGTTTTTRPKSSTAQSTASVKPKAAGPPPNGGAAKPHGGKVHNDAIDREIARLQQDPAVSNVRKNQQQVDVNGNNVGTNRPDIQYDRNGRHYCVEYDTNPSNGSRHGTVIQQNDPAATLDLRTP